jgi:hypothetical protein
VDKKLMMHFLAGITPRTRSWRVEYVQSLWSDGRQLDSAQDRFDSLDVNIVKRAGELDFSAETGSPILAAAWAFYDLVSEKTQAAIKAVLQRWWRSDSRIIVLSLILMVTYLRCNSLLLTRYK